MTPPPDPPPSAATIVVCDDEELIRWSLVEHLQGEGYRVIEAENGKVCLEKVHQEAPDLIITDLRMPELDGMALIRKLREEENQVPVIVITAHGDLDAGIEATQLGAKAFVSKPFDIRELGLAAKKVIGADRLEREVHYLRGRQNRAYGRILGNSSAMRRLFQTLDRLSGVSAPSVLLTGESGTGKDLIAHAIHDNGPRKDGPMMEVDCAGLPEQLIESELFGHERGSFTDAKTTKRGLFELARGGTIFLDEIGEMSMGTQAKLLRALENRRFKRVGGVAPIQLDAGVIAATNRNLSEEVREARFREDLFFRLNVIEIEVPSLRERREDIPLLVEHFVERFNAEFHREVEGTSAEAMELLRNYGWPGNVRELRNVIERMVILEADTVIEAQHLPGEIRYGVRQGRSSGGAHPFQLPEEGVDLEAVERSLIQQAMDRTSGNQSAAARLLGISRYALRYRLEKFELAAKG